MSSSTRSRLTYANVMATIAVFVALGGSSYAAIKVTGKNVRDGSLTGKDIKNSSLGEADVKNGSLLSKDFKPGQLPAGSQGPRGLTGLPGAQGPQGPSGVADLELVTATSSFPSTGDVRSARAVCPAGKTAVGGGGAVFGNVKPNPYTLELSAPALGNFPAIHGQRADSWIAQGEDPTRSANVQWSVNAYALCAKVS